MKLFLNHTRVSFKKCKRLVAMAETLKTIKYFKKYVKEKDVMKKCVKLSEKFAKEEILGAYIAGRNLEDCEFDSPCFLKYKNDETDFINFMECPAVEEGMFECGNCKSKKVYTMSKQTRAGDEATTVFAKCINCKKSWIVN